MLVPIRLPLLRTYLDLVLFSAIIDPEIALTYFNVVMLASPPSSLVRPLMVAHILAAAIKRAVKRVLGRKKTMALLFHPKSCLRYVPGLEVSN